MASPGYPCPNPTCGHVFNAAVVAGAATLTCPHCGTQFRFRAPTAPSRPPAQPLPPGPFAPTAIPVAAPRPAFPTAGPPGALPRALPTAMPAGALPPLYPPAGPPPGAAFEDIDDAPQGIAPYRRRSNTLGLYIKTLVFAGLLLGITGGVIYVYQNDLLGPLLAGKGGGTSVTVRPFVSEPLKYKFVAPPDWRPDDAMQTAARTNIALSRSEPTAWVGVIAKDFKADTPNPEGLVRMCLTPLSQLITGISYEEKDEKVTLAGRKAIRLLFEGNVQGTGTVFGEAFLISHGSIGYAVVLWAPQPVFGQALQEFPEVRKGFTLLE